LHTGLIHIKLGLRPLTSIRRCPCDVRESCTGRIIRMLGPRIWNIGRG